MPNAIFFYRISRWFFERKIPLIPKLFQLLIFVIYNCRIPGSASIGRGSFFVVKGIGVSIHDKTVIGQNCVIGIGVKVVGKSPFTNVSNIGDRVFIGPGAVLIGPIIIEDNVIIGANAVVTKSIPKGSIVGGIPAKIIGHIDDLDYDIFHNLSTDQSIAEFMQRK
tara:strand:+ start:2039 stop:2533 length:495 start_codon:yes stop_codon:yes gene_type:complete